MRKQIDFSAGSTLLLGVDRLKGIFNSCNLFQPRTIQHNREEQCSVYAHKSPILMVLCSHLKLPVMATYLNDNIRHT